MEFRKRLSLNTTLKDARIFESSSDEEDGYVKLEAKLETRQEIVEENAKHEITIKSEIKEELLEVNTKQEANIKQEADDNSNDSSNDNSAFIKIQKINETSPSNSYLEDSNQFIKLEKLEEIIECEEGEIQKESDCGTGFLSKVAEMALKTPIKDDDEYRNKISLKSTKRTLLKQKSSPYAKGEKIESRSPLKRYFSASSDEGVPSKKKTREMESDPEVLIRRQKQIDFGKNTIGYDNYIKLIPKDQRKQEDPVTPNKFRKYSRRGFDGLIKQWRLKLHKYDPQA